MCADVWPEASRCDSVTPFEGQKPEVSTHNWIDILKISVIRSQRLQHRLNVASGRDTRLHCRFLDNAVCSTLNEKCWKVSCCLAHTSTISKILGANSLSQGQSKTDNAVNTCDSEPLSHTATQLWISYRCSSCSSYSCLKDDSWKIAPWTYFVQRSYLNTERHIDVRRAPPCTKGHLVATPLLTESPVEDLTEKTLRI